MLIVFGYIGLLVGLGVVIVVRCLFSCVNWFSFVVGLVL